MSNRYILKNEKKKYGEFFSLFFFGWYVAESGPCATRFCISNKIHKICKGETGEMSQIYSFFYLETKIGEKIRQKDNQVF